jgi:transcription elongation GreA/GreB family factor
MAVKVSAQAKLGLLDVVARGSAFFTQSSGLGATNPLREMSRAFVKEDVEVPEGTRRVRPASGLPPGAVNYMTAHGARELWERIAKLRAAGGKHSAEIAELEQVLASATVVEIPQVSPECVAFGATVTVRAKNGELETYRIVGVDEVGLEKEAVSWVSPAGKALLGAEIGERVSLGGDDAGTVKVVKIEYREPTPELPRGTN